MSNCMTQLNFPTVIQLERRGSTFIMSTASFGEAFTSVQLDTMQMDKTSSS
jgi:hypothetical protein